ncbi:MAG TPA: ATP-binding protein [Anaerolineales bacterium]|nr:ATP-binding protein [Anaerolineales bacterium]HRQ92732.1 ATP-binding protein [Anaerolineales bacterium]
MQARGEPEAAISDKRVILALSWLVLLLGLVVYLGWAIHIPELAAILPNQAAMKANAALCFILLGAALVLRQRRPTAQRAANALLVLMLVVATLTLSQFIFDINIGIDELPFADDMSSISTEAPGRMSVSTAASFVALAVVMLFEGRMRESVRRFILVIVQALGISVFLSYPFSLAFGDSLFLYSGMALNTSILMVLATLSLLLAMPDRGWMDLIVARTPQGTATRRLLATVLLVPFVLGWLIYYGEDNGWYDAAFSRSTHTVAAMVLLGAIVISSAESMHRAGLTQRALQLDLNAVSLQLNSLIENSPSAISIKDVDGRYQMVNSQFERLAGLSQAQIIGKDADGVFKGTLLETVQENEVEALLTRRAATIEMNVQLEGKARTVLNLQFPLFDQEDELLGLGGIWTDITDQKQMEDNLRKKNIDLQRSNQELEQFAYVASHDLQEPLRMVSSYMQLLEARYKEKLDDDAKEFIDYAVDGAARMQRLIQDLLAFSRVGTRGRDPEAVDAGIALGEALQNLSVRIQENGARVEHGKLPTVFVDRNQLTQVMQNLVGNAIKFRAERQPVIRVSTERRGDFYEFKVADNGVGFDPKHAERIFVIFQRLNSREQYEGTGIGLAICKKIVERHGGRIWVESEPGQGSTFHFTLPRFADSLPAVEGEAAAAEGGAARPAAESVEQRAKRMI